MDNIAEEVLMHHLTAFGKIVIGHVAYIAWNSESDSVKILMGTDTFVFEGDKIKYHTVTDDRIKK